MTQVPEQPDEAQAAPERSKTEFPRGEVLHTEWSEAPSWFGYIGVGIAIFAMLLGIAAMVVGAKYLLAWVNS